MKKFFFVITILIFCLKTTSQANDISELEIEGMSVGDSLLKFVNIQKINSNTITDYYKDNKYSTAEFYPNDFNKNIKIENYQLIQIQFLSNDKQKKIGGISGITSYRGKLDECYNQLDSIFSEIITSFPTWNDLGKETYDHKGAGAKITDYVLENENQDEIQIACYDYKDDNNNEDHFRIALRSFEYRYWLANVAYK